MASVEETDNKVPATSPTTTEEHTSTTVIATCTDDAPVAVDDGNENMFHDAEEESSKATAKVEASVTTETAITQAETTTEPAPMNISTSTTMVTEETTTKVPAAPTAVEDTSTTMATEETATKLPATTTAVEHSSTADGTSIDLEDGNNNKKRKAPDDDESPSLMTITEAATVTTTPVTAHANIDDNSNNNGSERQDSPSKEPFVGDADDEGPPTEKPGSGSPRKDDKENKIVYYAIRAGGPATENPVIFFGFKEFDFFHKCVNEKLNCHSSFRYRVCDSLADALQYVEATDDPDALEIPKTGENSGESTSAAPSNKQRKLNPPALPQAAQQQQQQQQLQQQQLYHQHMLAMQRHRQMVAARTAASRQQQMMMAQPRPYTQVTRQLVPQGPGQQQLLAGPDARAYTKVTRQPMVNGKPLRTQLVVPQGAGPQQPLAAPEARARTQAPRQPVVNGQPLQPQLVVPQVAGPQKPLTGSELAAAKLAALRKYKWEEKFELLRQYKLQHGHCDVRLVFIGAPPAYIEKYKNLPPWVATQREQLRIFLKDPTSPMLKTTAEQRFRLMNLGFIVNVEDFRWNQYFALLQAYKAEYGDCNVLRTIDDPPLPDRYKPLALWGKKQQELTLEFDELGPTPAETLAAFPDKPKMTAERRKRLVDLGFAVDIEEFRWNQNFNLLKQYKRKHGNCNIFKTRDEPPLEEKYKPLIRWGGKVRELVLNFDQNKTPPREKTKLADANVKYKNMKMTAKRRRRLVNIGFPLPKTKQQKLEARVALFDEKFKKKIEEIKAYKEEHGTTVLPAGKKVRDFIWTCRRQYAALQEGRPSKLKLEHVVALTSLGFTMEPDHTSPKSVRERILQYVEYVKMHGREPHRLSKDREESLLASSAQRWRTRMKLYNEGIEYAKGYGKTQMPQDLKDALDSINFRWKVMDLNIPKTRPPQLTWDEKFDLLVKYKEKHGHCEPPKRHPKLGHFTHKIRQNYKFMVQNKKTSITVDRFRKLSEIGFRFKTAAVAGVENRRKRFVDNGSSGYDTTTDEDNNNNNNETEAEEEDNNNNNETEADEEDNNNNNETEAEEEDNNNNETEAEEEEITVRNLRRIGKGFRRNRDDEDNSGRGGNDGHGLRDDDDSGPGAASYVNTRSRRWMVPDDCMWG